MKLYLIYFALFFFCGCAIFSPKIHKERKNINSTIDSIIIGFKERDTTILKKYAHKKNYDVFMDITDSLKNDDEVQSYIEYFDRNWKFKIGDNASKVYILSRKTKTGRHYNGYNLFTKIDKVWVLTCYARSAGVDFVGTCVD